MWRNQIGTARLAARPGRRRCGESGVAALEATLYALVVIIPVVWLSYFLWHVGTMGQNAMGAARHGAFRDSMYGWAHFGDRRDETGLARDVAESDIQKYLAAVPKVKKAVLQPPSGGGRVVAWAAVQSDVPLVRTVEGSTISGGSTPAHIDYEKVGVVGPDTVDTARARLIMEYRDPDLYAYQGKGSDGPSHTKAQEVWEAFVGAVELANIL